MLDEMPEDRNSFGVSALGETGAHAPCSTTSCCAPQDATVGVPCRCRSRAAPGCSGTHRPGQLGAGRRPPIHRVPQEILPLPLRHARWSSLAHLPRPLMKADQFRTDLRAWLDENDLTPGPDHSLEGHIKQLARVHSALYDADWMRYGWPERVGGLGGPAMLRAVVGEEVVGRRLAEPGPYSMVEVLAPTMIDYAPPELAAEMVPRLLSGREQWCQGFSEPGSGSDLASLTTRAAPHVTIGSSTGRRSGPATRNIRRGASCSPAPHPATMESPPSSSTWIRRASPFGRCARCTESTSSARSTSTTW